MPSDNTTSMPVVEPSPQAQAPQTPQAPQAPQTPQAPPPANAPSQQPAGAPAALPPAFLKVPAFQALLAGTPPAVSMRVKGAEDRDEIKMVSENKEAILGAGMGFYRSMSGQLGVIFNALKIHPQDLQAADKAGKLPVVAPDFDTINHEVSKLNLTHPIRNAQPPPAQFASPMSTAAPQAASGMLPLVPPAPASVARKLAAQRILNMQAGAPTSGPEPGAGRLLNSIMKPVV